MSAGGHDGRSTRPVSVGVVDGGPDKARRSTVVGSQKMATFDDMQLERKLTIYDKGFDEDARADGEYIPRSGDVFSPQVPNLERLQRSLDAHGVRS